MYKLINYYTQHFSFPHRGWKYFYRVLKWFGLSKREYRKKISSGLYMLVTPSDHIQQQLFWYGCYEKPVALLLEKLVRPNDIIFDLGANVGYFTVIAAQRAKGGKVFAFEPVKELFEQLRKNIEENDLQNAQAINAAAGESEHASLIYIADASNVGMSSLGRPENFSGCSQTIQVVNMDSWIKQSEIDRVDVIKLDVEGYELFALRGMKETLMNFRPLLIVEINADTLAYFNLLPSDVMTYLADLSFVPFEITRNGFLQSKANTQEQENIVFIHSGRLKEYNSYQ